MEKQVIHVELEPDTDLHELVEEVHSDGVPRLLERNGEALAVLAPTENYTPSTAEPKSRRNRDTILALAGAWKDLDGDALIEDLYKARNESPPSPPVDL